MPWIANVGEAAAEHWKDRENCVVVSITEPKHEARLGSWVDILRLGFQDYDPGTAHNPRKHPPNAVLFDRHMAARLSRFLRKHRGKNILVHCAAGISRSGAVVEAVLEAFPEYEDKGWMRYPNVWVKILCKRALGLVPLDYDEERPHITGGDQRINFTKDGDDEKDPDGAGTDPDGEDPAVL